MRFNRPGVGGRKPELQPGKATGPFTDLAVVSLRDTVVILKEGDERLSSSRFMKAIVARSKELNDRLKQLVNECAQLQAECAAGYNETAPHFREQQVRLHSELGHEGPADKCGRCNDKAVKQMAIKAARKEMPPELFNKALTYSPP